MYPKKYKQRASELKEKLITIYPFRKMVLKDIIYLEMINLLHDKSNNSALSYLQILAQLKKYKLDQIHISRRIRTFAKYEPSIFRVKKIGAKSYFWLEIKPTTSTKTNSPNKPLQKIKNETNKPSKKEIDYYEEVKMWLNNNCLLEENRYNFHIHGGGNIFKTKWTNPDIIGSNIIGSKLRVISVEVKVDLNNEAELTGFSQCCSYAMFSDYVYFFCLKPKEIEKEARIVQMCSFYGFGLKFFEENSLRVEARLNEKIGDHFMRSKIINLFP
jgi:hypothetical protein